MLNELFKIERELPTLLREKEAWTGLFADTEKPHLRRLWRQWGKNRIYLHHFSGCSEQDVFWHPHPWKMAVRSFSRYDQLLGARDELGNLIVVARTIMEPGSCYEMTNRWGEHAIRPDGPEAWSLMIAGPVLWPENRRVANTPVRELTQTEREKIFNFFSTQYA